MAKNKKSTDQQYELPQWAPRISKAKIAQLYISDAKGIVDEELIDEVGISLLVRCESSLTATEAVRGKLPCPRCGHIIHHKTGIPGNQKRKELIRCQECSWEILWSIYIKPYRGQHLSAGGMEPFIREFAQKYPKAKTPHEKLVLIDILVHRFHGELKNRPGRIGAVNLIQGQAKDITAFLDDLAYSGHNTPELRATVKHWKETRAKHQL